MSFVETGLCCVTVGLRKSFGFFGKCSMNMCDLSTESTTFYVRRKDYSLNAVDLQISKSSFVAKQVAQLSKNVKRLVCKILRARSASLSSITQDMLISDAPAPALVFAHLLTSDSGTHLEISFRC